MRGEKLLFYDSSPRNSLRGLPLITYKYENSKMRSLKDELPLFCKHIQNILIYLAVISKTVHCKFLFAVVVFSPCKCT